MVSALLKSSGQKRFSVASELGFPFKPLSSKTGLKLISKFDRVNIGRYKELPLFSFKGHEHCYGMPIYKSIGWKRA